MIPAHHLPDELLVELSAGTADEAHSVFAASHLTFCPACRSRRAELDALGGAVLRDLGDGAAPSLEAVIARIRQPEPVASAHGDPVIPRPLLRYTGPSASIRWRRQILGFGRVDLPLPALRLLRLPAGHAIPEHRHGADELALVLRGGYTDSGVDYVRGDVAAHEANEVHRPQVHEEGACWLLLLHAGRYEATRWTGRFGIWLVDG